MRRGQLEDKGSLPWTQAGPLMVLSRVWVQSPCWALVSSELTVPADTRAGAGAEATQAPECVGRDWIQL